MDEQDNDQFDKPKIRGEESGDQTSSSPLSSRSIGPLGLAPAGNMITQPTNGAGNSAVISGQPSAIGSRSNVFTIIRPAAPAQDFAIRRVRINRILMRKRRLQRLDLKQNATSRVLVTCLIVALVMMFLFSSSVGAAYAYYQSQLPLLNGIATHTLFQTTHIYDRNGHLLYELNDPKYGRRIYVNYNDIAPVLLNATVAAEDHTFWTNAGIDLQGILRAAFANLQQQTVVEGASTITQQLIKRELFSDQPRTLQIKAEEAILAYGLTQQYPKWKIIEMYLNAVYYGDLNYGVEAAAENYFGLQAHCTHSTCKTAASQLDLAQASMLAGLPQSPTYLNPIANKPAALDRQNTVLQAMVQLGMITQTQATQAHNEMANYKFKSISHGIQAPHFVHYVIDQVLVPLLGAQNLLDGGYNIYTTLDLGLEQKVERITYNALYHNVNGSGALSAVHNVNNAAVVVMNPSNGEILAMNGSANYHDNSRKVRGQYNAAVAARQPGSSIKPIIYATAFEMGWYPAMIIPDHKTIYPAGKPPAYYAPRNYDGTFHKGFAMTARNAIANSFNIPAIDTLEFAGIPNVLNMAARMGLTEMANRRLSTLGPSIAIGTVEVSLLHLTGAYATFANRGVRVPPTSILEITDSQGHPLYTYDAAHAKGFRALREDVAFLISSILADKRSRYHEFSPGNPLELDRPAAAKTGTTDSFRDNWTLGYTPYLTVGVWAGNSDNSTMNQVIGITGAGPIWHDVMEYASQRYHYPPNDFIRPPDVHAGTVSAYTGLLPHSGEPTVTDWFIDGTMPTIQGPYTPGHKKCNGDNCKPICVGNICICVGNKCKPRH